MSYLGENVMYDWIKQQEYLSDMYERAEAYEDVMNDFNINNKLRMITFDGIITDFC